MPPKRTRETDRLAALEQAVRTLGQRLGEAPPKQPRQQQEAPEEQLAGQQARVAALEREVWTLKEVNRGLGRELETAKANIRRLQRQRTEQIAERDQRAAERRGLLGRIAELEEKVAENTPEDEPVHM